MTDIITCLRCGRTEGDLVREELRNENTRLREELEQCEDQLRRAQRRLHRVCETLDVMWIEDQRDPCQCGECEQSRKIVRRVRAAAGLENYA